MDNLKSHIDYWRNKGFFEIKFSDNFFSQEEKSIINYYGYWFKALTSGDLLPFTDKQKRFIELTRPDIENNNKQTTIYERAWFKYLGREKVILQRPNLEKVKYELENSDFYSREHYYQLHPYKRNRK